MLVYSADKGTFTVAAASGISGVTAGAVDPANGLYYFAAGADLYSFDPTTAKVSDGPVATLPAAGQLAFDRAGHGYLYASGALSLFTVGSATLTPLLDGLPDSVTGIAFGADGYLYLTGGGNAVARVDPADGTLVATLARRGRRPGRVRQPLPAHHGSGPAEGRCSRRPINSR